MVAAVARPAGWIAAGLLALALAWLGTPTSAPPLYDGLVLSNEPYRYLNPPPGAVSTKPPGEASVRVRVQRGAVGPLYVVTGEQPPQASLSAGNAAVAVSSSTRSVTIHIRAVPAPGQPPAGRRFDGNIYEITAAAGEESLSLRPQADVRIALRGTGLKGHPELGSWNGRTWVTTPTLATGFASVYSAATSTLGSFVLLVPAVPPAAPASTGVGASSLLLFLAAAITAAAAALLGVRLRRRHAS